MYHEGNNCYEDINICYTVGYCCVDKYGKMLGTLSVRKHFKNSTNKNDSFYYYVSL